MRAKEIAALGLCASLMFCASSQAKLQKAQQKDPRYQYNMGLFYLNQNNPDEAVKYLVKALALDTRYHLAWNAMGLAHSLKGRLEEARKAFEKCLEIEPRFTEARNNLGTILQEMKLLDQAEAEFKTALLDPAYPNRELPYFNLARLYVLQDRLEEALDNVQKAIQIQPRLAMAHNLRGVIMERKDNSVEAVASYEQAVKIVPDDVLFNYNLGTALFKSGSYARAKEVFLRISPRVTDPEMRDNIARFLKIISEKGGA